MAKKKKGLAAFVAKKATEKKEAAPSKSNPPPLTDFAEFIVPGFAGYAGTRFTSRVAHQMLLKRWPKLAKHGSVLSTFGAATAAWLLVHRIKRLEKYHTPVVVGAGIAALQTVVQAYVPKYGWLVSDHNINEAPALPAPEKPADAPQETAGLPALFTNWKPKKAASKVTATPSRDDDVSIDMDDDFDFGSLGSDDADGDGLSDADIDDLLN
jgi:hypothetical protein